MPLRPPQSSRYLQLWDAPLKLTQICSFTCKAKRCAQQAAPANVPNAGLSLRAKRIIRTDRETKYRAGPFAGAACLTRYLGLLRTGKNIRDPWTHAKSGLPDVASRSLDD
jgi:hypothetical protein